MTSTKYRAVSRALPAPGRRRAWRARLLALPPVIALLLLAGLAILAAPPAEAGACTVPSGKHATLQAAVNDEACALVSVGNVTLNENVAITRSVAVQGLGAANSIIDGNAAGRVINVSAGIDVSLSGLTVQNGHLNTGSGAGVLNAGRLTLANVRLSQNMIHVAAHSQYGAGLHNASSGVVTLTNVIAAHNEMSATTTSSRFSGGAGLGNQGVMTATNVQVYSNTIRIVSGRGGGTHNNGTLALNNSAVTSNTIVYVGGLSDGGGIQNQGTAVIQGGVIAANFVASVGSRGGGVNNQGHLELSGVLIANNTVSATITAEGGGVNNWGQYLAANNVTLRGNTVSAPNGDGAGLLNSPGGPVLAGAGAPQGEDPPGPVGFTWVGGLIESNSASRRGGGVYNAGPLSLEGTRIMSNTAGGEGGGIYNLLPGSYDHLAIQGLIELPEDVLHLDGVTLRANTAGGDGGGLYNHGYAQLLNTTAEANSAGGSGGGIYTGRAPVEAISAVTGIELTPTLVFTGANLTLSGNHAGVMAGGLIAANDGAAVLLHVTVVSNTVDGAQPAGLVVSTTGSISLHSSVAAHNQNANCSAGVSSAGYNLDSGSSCALASTGDAPNTNPLIGPLANNGGPVRTHALLEGSPALDTADGSACPATDARGEPRPSGAGCDIGAYELQIAGVVEYRLYLPLVVKAGGE